MKRSTVCIVLVGLCTNPLSAIITEVYNLRISETTRKSAFEEHLVHPLLGTGTIITQYRKKYDGLIHHLLAGMGTFSYTLPSWYIRMDVAGGRIRSDDHGVRFSRNQMDDFLITSGLSHELTPRIKLTGSGLLGIPLHKDTSLCHVQLGYGHVGLGVQADGSFLFESDRRWSMRSAMRYIRFLDRKVSIDCYKPCDDLYQYTFGNLIDLFVAYHFSSEKIRWEIGYDLTILSGSDIKPFVPDIEKRTNYVRSDAYTSLKYRYMIGDDPGAFTLALSCGTDNSSHRFGYRILIAVWGALEINF